MSKRVCLGPSTGTRCPAAALIDSSRRRCPACSGKYERARGSRHERGYDREHDIERARWVPIVKRGGVLCRRCREPLDPDAPFDLGHPDAHCERPRAPEHVACNRAVNGR